MVIDHSSSTKNLWLKGWVLALIYGFAPVRDTNVQQEHQGTPLNKYTTMESPSEWSSIKEELVKVCVARYVRVLTCGLLQCRKDPGSLRLRDFAGKRNSSALENWSSVAADTPAAAVSSLALTFPFLPHTQPSSSSFLLVSVVIQYQGSSKRGRWRRWVVYQSNRCLLQTSNPRGLHSSVSPNHHISKGFNRKPVYQRRNIWSVLFDKDQE